MKKEELEKMIYEDLKNEIFGECLDRVEITHFDDSEEPTYFEAYAYYSGEIFGKFINLLIVIEGKIFSNEY